MGNVKQVIVIRRDLRMRRGKEIAQGAHASAAWVVERVSEAVASNRVPQLSEVEQAWIGGCFTKITCRVDSVEELLDLYDKATEAGLQAHLITDAGRTEFHGEPTITALGIGPGTSERMDPVTGHLKLY